MAIIEYRSMKRFFFVLLLASMWFDAYGQSSLPPCPKNKNLTWTNCAGRFDWPDGEYYIGEFRDDKRNGSGFNYFVGGLVYAGTWVSDKRQGKGTETKPDGSVYVGDFSNNERAGRGVLTFPSGEKYEGEFSSGVRHGQGKKTFPDGATYDGEWRDDSPTERGNFASPWDRRPNDSPQREMSSSSKTAVEAVQACLKRGLKPGSAQFSKCIAGE